VRTDRTCLTFCLLVAASGPIANVGAGTAEVPDASSPLVGIWEASRQFGDELRGTLSIRRIGGDYVAEIGPYRAVATGTAKRLRFAFGDGRGWLRLHVREDRRLEAFWVQPKLQANGTAYASPVTIAKIGKDAWQGQVMPVTDTFTLYLGIERQEDGMLGGFIKNPERNIGIFQQVSRIDVHGSTVNVYTRFRGVGDERLYSRGSYDDESERLSLFVPSAGATFDFSRAGENSHFYARGKTPKPWVYAPPFALDDGWPVGTLEEAHIDAGPLREMIETEIDPAPVDVHSHDLHGVLIARHGKLVFEEYFHGFNRGLPHDTRSASKSVTATLYGAAIQAGLVQSTHVPVFETMLSKDVPPDLDPLKRHMEAEHLLTQASGFYCDDGDPNAPGSEDRMQNQTAEPDWYRYTLSVPMATSPGEKAVYCSANSNLLGGVLARATGLPLENLVGHLFAEPLEIKRYYLNLQPTGQPYMGGGIRWLPRDFMKLGQLYLDHGIWKRRRVVSADWVERASSPLVHIGERGYGYQWWVQDYPYRDGAVRVFYAGGNGGQVVAVVPRLDLVVAFYGGNYSDAILYKSQNVLFPQYILEAVE
jgi:CubicO group peptidase (beta-lactamase class C family)